MPLPVDSEVSYYISSLAAGAVGLGVQAALALFTHSHHA